MTKKDKLNRLAKAANALHTAADALEQIANDKSDGWYLCPDAADMRRQILEILSCDNNQAGLDALISKVNRQVA